MSIVEQALSKLQRADAANAAERRTPPQPLREHAARVIGTPADGPPPARRIPAHIEMLRAAALLPRQADAHRLADEYRKLKWPLLGRAFGRAGEDRGERGNLIMVASAVAGEGKTFASVNLALSIAKEKDCSAILVDGDIAKGHITSAFGAASEPGLVELLADSSRPLRDCLLDTAIPGVWLLPRGKVTPAVPELIASRRMDEIALELAERYRGHVVVFDSSPLLATNEAALLAKVVGQVVVVVRAEHTPQAAVLEALSFLDQSKAVSLVLNQSRFTGRHEYY
jgi:protein-tyrosine kinase